MSEREGLYEKAWTDFISLQRGDAKQLVSDALRYRWLKENRSTLLVTGFFGNGCINKGVDDVDAEIDSRRVVTT